MSFFFCNFAAQNRVRIMENELLSQIKTEATEYVKSVSDAGKYHAVGAISRILGMFLLLLTVLLCAIVFLTFAAVAAVAALATCMPLWAAALVVGSVFALLIVIALIWRKALFVHPLIRRMTKEAATEEDLANKITEAKHHAEIQRVKMECHAENAVRDVKYYAGLIAQMWEAVAGEDKG